MSAAGEDASSHTGQFIPTISPDRLKPPCDLAKAPRSLIRVPMTRQATNYTCGVAALQSLLQFYGEEYREDTLAKLVNADPDLGTSYHDMLNFVKTLGFEGCFEKDVSLEKLKEVVDSGVPPIVCIQAWADVTPDPKEWKDRWDDGHWVLVIGYDDNRFYFMDPSTLGNYTYIPTEEFLDRWHDTDGTDPTPLHHAMVTIRSPPSRKSAFSAYRHDFILPMY